MLVILIMVVCRYFEPHSTCTGIYIIYNMCVCVCITVVCMINCCLVIIIISII